VSCPLLQGIFVGALLSMSSTSVVVKCLDAVRMNGTAFGQIVIGTLILQVRLRLLSF
jgi:Kef-type K+ transport system membrane component KefB